MTRRLDATAGTLFALVLCGSAYVAIIHSLGDWLARGRWIAGFSARYPDLYEWSLGGVRTMDHVANPLWAWAAVALWAGVTWRAGWLEKGAFRLPWMLAAMGGLITCVGLGDVDMAYALCAGVTGARVLVKGPVKPHGFGIFLSVSGVFAAMSLWDTSLANPPPSPWVHHRAGLIGALIAMGGVALCLRHLRGKRSEHGAWIAAIITACVYVGVGHRDMASAWSARIRAVRALASSPSEYRLKEILNRYRLSEWEASMQRYPDTASGTRWRLLPEALNAADRAKAPLIAAWLKADAALFLNQSAAEKARMRDEALTAITGLDLTDRNVASVAYELEGWLRHDAGDTAGSEKAFVGALNSRPENPMAWYGLALVFAQSERPAQSARSYGIFALLEPRAVFSPALDHAPLSGVKPEVERMFIQSSAELSEYVSTAEAMRWERYAAWRSAWSLAGNDVQKFLTDPRSPDPVSEGVACVRDRISELLPIPDEARSAAIVSSGVAILADRHVNVGKAIEISRIIFISQPGVLMMPSEVKFSPPQPLDAFGFGAAPAPTASIKTRPTMVGWLEASSIDAGGCGASLAYFEENLVIRLLTYGQESAPIRLPEFWLREKLAEVSRR